jgi:DNA-binding transcriptional MocR family regulator
MSFEASIWALKQAPALSMRAKAVLPHLADYVHNGERICIPSQERLAEDAGISVRTVRRAINDMEERQLIKVRPRMRRSGRGRRSDSYELFGPPFLDEDEYKAELAVLEKRLRRGPSAMFDDDQPDRAVPDQPDRAVRELDDQPDTGAPEPPLVLEPPLVEPAKAPAAAQPTKSNRRGNGNNHRGRGLHRPRFTDFIEGAKP